MILYRQKHVIENRAKHGMHVYGVFDLGSITTYLNYRRIVTKSRAVVGTARTKFSIDNLKNIYTPEYSIYARIQHAERTRLSFAYRRIAYPSILRHCGAATDRQELHHRTPLEYSSHFPIQCGLVSHIAAEQTNSVSKGAGFDCPLLS